MSNSNTIKITPSSTDIEGKLLSIIESKANMLDINNIDFLKSGYFGYINEALAMAIRDSAWYKTFLSREMSIYTATTPKYIYNWAKLFNIDVLLATPAYANVTFQIPLVDLDSKIKISDDISNYMPSQQKINCIIIDNASSIIADNVYFSLEHSIAIIKNDTDSSYIVRYCTDEKNVTTNFGSYINPIIPSTIVEVNGIKYLIFMATVYQYTAVETEKVITSTNQINSKIFNFQFNNQICGMSLKYLKGNTDENIQLFFSNIYSDKDVDSKYAYYSLNDENTIEITCVDSKHGLPQNGGTLKFKVYETLGAAGNINYNSNAIIIFGNDQLQDLPVTLTFTDGCSISGENAKNLTEIKETIINKISTRDTIITESDLNTFFANETKYLKNVNNTDVSFKKERDDIIKRSFYVMLGMREIDAATQNVVIPTNTIDVNLNMTDVPANQIDNGMISITPENTIAYDSTRNEYVFTNSTSTDIDISNSYKIPFNLNICLGQFKKSQYTHFSTNDSSELITSESKYSNNIILPSSCSVYKDILSDSYEVIFNITSDIPLSNVFDNNINNTAKLLVYLNDYSYSAYDINYNDMEINVVGDSNSDTIKQYEIKIPLRLENIDTVPTCALGSQTVSINTSIKLGLHLNISYNSGINDITFTSKYYMLMYTRLDDIMSSNIILKTDENNHLTSLVVKDVPVVANYWCSENDMSSFVKQLMIYINILKENESKLETNTSFNLKFKNTHGVSHYYDSNVTNIRLKLNIYLNAEGIAVSEDSSRQISIFDEIRTFIRLAVDGANSSKELSVVKIMAATFAEYSKYVAHIEFISLNGTFNQYIKGTALLTESDKYARSKYVDEYFTLDMTTDANGVPRINNDILFYNISNNTRIIE